MKITREEVLHVAKLARLALRGEEVEQMTDQLDTILTYVAKLDELDTTNIPSLPHTQQAVNAFRNDEVRDSLPRELALSGSQHQNGESFVVPRIIS